MSQRGQNTFLRREHYVFIGLHERIQMKNTVD